MAEILKYDIVIFGGGTSGCSCAYTCAKNNLKTLLVEKNNFLGGLMTGGLVVPVMKSSVENLNCNYYNDLVKLSKKFNAQITYKDKNDGWFNPQLLKIILDELLNFSNLDILFETYPTKASVNKNKVVDTEIKSDILSLPIEAKYYVDATGSADFSYLCNCEFIPQNEIQQLSSLRFVVGNVNLDKFCEFIKQVDDDENITNTYRSDIDTNNELHFTTASVNDDNKIWALDKYLKKGVEDNILKESDRAYFQLFSIAGSNNEVAFNCPRMFNYKDNPFMMSNELKNARRAIYRLYQFAKRYFPGFENSTITNIASQTGIREQRRVKTRYMFTKDDLISQKHFSNPVLKANYSIDIHGDKKNSSVLQKTLPYELPIDALISAQYDNLFVIGKILGADFSAHSALRVQKSCMSMGEAVGKYIKNQI